MGASSIGNAPNQPARHGPADPTSLMRQSDPATSAPRYPFRTSKQPPAHTPLSDPTSPVQNRSTLFSPTSSSSSSSSSTPRSLRHSPSLLAPSAIPPVRNPLHYHHSWRGAGCRDSAPRLSSGSPYPLPPWLEDPGAFYILPAITSVHRSPSSSALEDSTIYDILLAPAVSSSAPVTCFLSA
jgi:hypothetical protein